LRHTSSFFQQKNPINQIRGLLIFFHFPMVQVYDKLWWLSSELTVCNGTNWKEREKEKKGKEKKSKQSCSPS